MATERAGPPPVVDIPDESGPSVMSPLGRSALSQPAKVVEEDQELHFQLQYERALLDEICKLQETLEQERQYNERRAQQLADEKQEAKEARKRANAQFAKTQQLEDAMQAAKDAEREAITKRREQAEARKLAKEAESEKTRAMEARKKEQQRQIARQLHDETMAKATASAAAAAEEKRKRDAEKEASLRARLAHDKAVVAAKNEAKAKEATGKILRAAEQRTRALREQRAAFKVRHAEQERRATAMAKAIAEKTAATKAKGQAKSEEMRQKRADLATADEKHREALKAAEAEKDARVAAQFDRLEATREQKAHDRSLRLAASRRRVDATMEGLQHKLGALEAHSGERGARAQAFADGRRDRIEEGKTLAVTMSLERQLLSNTVTYMRANPRHNHTRYTVPAKARAMMQSPELKALMAKVDPDGTGMTLGNLRSTLTTLNTEKAKSQLSKSLPALAGVKPADGAPELTPRTRTQRLMEEFRNADTDNSGFISKRELYTVLEKAGLAGGAQELFLRMFDGFDVNKDGKLSFDEFSKLALSLKSPRSLLHLR